MTERSAPFPPRYAELHAHSAFSFLDGASHPEELVEQAARLGLAAVAITDHDGFYGVVRFAEAARAHGIRTVFGAELSLPSPGAGDRAAPRTGDPDPAGQHLLVLARGVRGYAALSRVISEAHLRGGEKGRPAYQLEQLAAALRDQVLVLTGCRKGHVPGALRRAGPAAAAAELDRLVEQASTVRDLTSRRGLLQAALKLAAADRFVLPLIVPADLYGLRRDLPWEPSLALPVAGREMRRGAPAAR